VRTLILQATLILLLVCGQACSPASYAREADEQTYDILTRANARVTGDARVFPIERPADSLRQRLLASNEPLSLSLAQALDVAAENSRDFQRQKEILYLAALALTREQHDFALRFVGGGGAEIDGVADKTAGVSLSDDLSASANSVTGGRIVAGFVNNWLRSIVNGGGWNASSLLNLSITQPLMRGFGRRIAREPLTPAERNVIYAVRDFERFRSTFAVRVVSEYYGVAEQIRNLASENSNLEKVTTNQERAEALFAAERIIINEVDQARQNVFAAEARKVSAINRLQSSLDRFKLTLGLPVDAQIDLDVTELDRLVERGVEAIELTEADAVARALAKRYDLRTIRDEVDDAARRIVVAEDALRSSLDFSAVAQVPTDPNQPLKFDFSRVSWAAGFDLNLALDKLAERNAYRTSLINLDAAIRSREQAEDQIKNEIRGALRNILSTLESYQIQVNTLTLARRRVDSTDLLFKAGRVQQRDVNDARDAELAAEIALTGALVDYAVARLELMRDLESLRVDGQGLRFELPAVRASPLPEAAAMPENDPLPVAGDLPVEPPAPPSPSQ
jgi:outer membrane protein TolC